MVQSSPAVAGFGAPGLRYPERPGAEFRISGNCPILGVGFGSKCSRRLCVPAPKVTLQRKCGKMVPSTVDRAGMFTSCGLGWGALGILSMAVHPPLALHLGASLSKENKMASAPRERGHLSAACVGKPCVSFMSEAVCCAGSCPCARRGLLPWVAAPPACRSGCPGAICPERERKDDSVPVCACACVSMTV